MLGMAIAILLIAPSFSWVVPGTWGYLGENDSTYVLFRPAVPRLVGGYSRIWVRWEYISPTGPSYGPQYRSQLILDEVDCTGRRMRALQSQSYPMSNEQGESVGATGVEGWEYGAPDTFGEKIISAACGS